MKTLQDIYNNYKVDADTGVGDKGTTHDYIGIYSDYINQNNCKSLLEIGVANGHSIKMWEEYLPESKIIGVDIDISVVNFKFDKAELIEVDAASEDVLGKLGKETFDVIIDDGSHKIAHQIKSLELLYPKLNTGGYYFIEDIVYGDNEKKLILFLEDNGFKYKIFKPIEKSMRYDDIIVVISK
jgi:cephalosporin hydroxylase